MRCPLVDGYYNENNCSTKLDNLKKTAKKILAANIREGSTGEAVSVEVRGVAGCKACILPCAFFFSFSTFTDEGLCLQQPPLVANLLLLLQAAHCCSASALHFHALFWCVLAKHIAPLLLLAVSFHRKGTTSKRVRSKPNGWASTSTSSVTTELVSPCLQESQASSRLHGEIQRIHPCSVLLGK